MHSVFKATILQAIHRHEATRLKRRPLSLDPVEAVDCLLKLVRTGMQWRELQPKTASHISVCVLDRNRKRGATPCIEGATPWIEGATPCIEGAAPCIEGATPCIECATPCIEGATPCIEGATPCIEGTTPCIEGATPCIEGATPCIEGATPCIEGARQSSTLHSQIRTVWLIPSAPITTTLQTFVSPLPCYHPC